MDKIFVQKVFHTFILMETFFFSTIKMDNFGNVLTCRGDFIRITWNNIFSLEYIMQL